MKSLPVGNYLMLISAVWLGGLLRYAPALSFQADHLRYFLYYNICPRCDLSNANLSYLDLRGADLRQANLRGANLSYSDLSYSDLREADLREAITVGTIFVQIKR